LNQSTLGKRVHHLKNQPCGGGVNGNVGKTPRENLWGMTGVLSALQITRQKKVGGGGGGKSDGVPNQKEESHCNPDCYHPRGGRKTRRRARSRKSVKWENVKCVWLEKKGTPKFYREISHNLVKIHAQKKNFWGESGVPKDQTTSAAVLEKKRISQGRERNIKKNEEPAYQRSPEKH